MSVRSSMNVAGTVSALSFWLGALLPFAYLPVLAAGLDSPSRLLTFLGLLALNVVALVIGHDHARRRSR